MALHSVFFSYNFDRDATRAAHVRDMGVVKDSKPVSADDWEAVVRRGDPAIRSWIDRQLRGKHCLVVLIGPETAGREWIEYEITKAWDSGLGVVGVHVHSLLDRYKKTAIKGANPFKELGTELFRKVKAYDPPHWSHSGASRYIKENLAAWVAEAIAIRENY